jgi:hypothetical protein
MEVALPYEKMVQPPLQRLSLRPQCFLPLEQDVSAIELQERAVVSEPDIELA